MRKCPACTTKLQTLEVKGVLVIGTGTLRSQKDEETITPIVPKLSLNESGFRQHCVAICPNCKHEGQLDEFPTLFTCYFYPKHEATKTVLLAGREYHVSDMGAIMADLLENVDISIPSLGEFGFR